MRMTRSIGILIAAILVLGIAGTAMFSRYEEERALSQWQEKLSLIADARTREVNAWFAGEQRELGALADNASLQIYFTTLAESKNGKPNGQADYLRNLLTLTAQRLGFEQSQSAAEQQLMANVRKLATGGLALIDTDGHVLMATGHMPPLSDAQLDQLRAATRGESHLWDNAGSEDTPKLMFSLPIYSIQATKEANAQMGMLVGIRPLSDVQAAFAEALPTPEKTLEVALVRMQSKGAEYLTPLLDGTLSKQEPAEEDSAANYAMLHPDNFAEKTDYRGKKVLMVSRGVAAVNWAVIAKVDRGEALAGTLAKRNSMTLAIAMLVAALLATVIAVWRNATARHQALLAEEYGAQAELLSVVTDHQNEALYMLDAQLRLHFVNRRAAEVMKSSVSYILGKPIDNVAGSAFAEKIAPLVQQTLETEEPQSMTLTRGTGISQEHHYLSFIPLAHIPVRGMTETTPGVLVVEQDTTEIIREREMRVSTLNQLVAMLVSLVDKRDPNAAEHSARVAAISRAVAEQMNLSPEMIETTETAARLMNFGKVDVPVELLTRDGKLSEAEHEAIRNSLTASAELLKGVAFNGPVSDTLRQAQERVDGKGPMKLKGENILVSARIISVANALVSMASPRAYRAPIEVDAALKILQSESAQRFDHKVISAMAHYLDNQGGRRLLMHSNVA